eukprot:TRINITY_DN2751_c0_g1_i3.p1 TRINITY_DN2751_c0_g1~~TRINITY_DN2751_c0_g1_i3.p1  ORF type:complete len:253 (-),score=3.08 TRINITY_DN2751_c0_g1_i3:68-826(-)
MYITWACDSFMKVRCWGANDPLIPCYKLLLIGTSRSAKNAFLASYFNYKLTASTSSMVVEKWVTRVKIKSMSGNVGRLISEIELHIFDINIDTPYDITSLYYKDTSLVVIFCNMGHNTSSKGVAIEKQVIGNLVTELEYFLQQVPTILVSASEQPPITPTAQISSTQVLFDADDKAQCAALMSKFAVTLHTTHASPECTVEHYHRGICTHQIIATPAGLTVFNLPTEWPAFFRFYKITSLSAPSILHLQTTF